MADSDIAEIYARSILDVARAEGVAERVENDLFQFSQALDANAELRDRLADPGLDIGTKLGVIDELLGGHPQSASAIMWVVQSGHVRQLSDVASAVVSQAAAQRGRVVAEVRAAVPLNEQQERELAAALSRSSGKDVELKVVVDPDVLGGIVAKMGDTVIDGSVSRRLAELRGRLIGAS